MVLHTWPAVKLVVCQGGSPFRRGSDLAVLQVKLQPSRHTMPPGLMADITLLTADSLFDPGHGVIRRDDASGEFSGKHRQIVQMVPGRKGVRSGDSQLARNFPQSSAFIVTGMTEAGIN